MQVVFDTNVYVSALIGSHAPRQLMELWTTTRPFELVVSPALLIELRDVLHRTKFRRWFSGDDADILVDRLESEATSVKDETLDEQITVDPDDDYLIALGRAANADAIISGDRDLTDLSDPDPIVLAPTEFLNRLRSTGESPTR